MTNAIPASNNRGMTPGELAARWGQSRGHLANLRSARRGCPYVKMGGSVRYLLRDVVAFEEASRIGTIAA